MLSERKFKSIVDSYCPIQTETDCPSGHYLKDQAYRYYRMLAFVSNKTISTAVDVGCYPGTLLRLLRAEYPHMQLFGLGLGLTGLTRVLKDAQIQLLEVNLDPDIYFDGYHTIPIIWEIADSSVDVVFATEVIEHLYNPFHMLKQYFRVLKPGGYLYLTTDNITNLGAIFSMVRGRSPNGSLATSTVLNKPKSTWRGHVRLYSRRELREIHQAVGFAVISSKQFFNKKWYTMDGRYSVLEMLLRNYVLRLVPSLYRGHHEIIAQKPF